MTVNFKIHGINKGVHKLTRTFMLIKKNMTQLILNIA